LVAGGNRVPKTTPGKPAVPRVARLKVVEVLQESPDVKTFRLDNSASEIPLHRPGQFLKLCQPIDGVDTWRSFTISSAPGTPGLLDVTIKRNPAGQLSNALHDSIEPGTVLTVKGPQGGFYFDEGAHQEPLVLISAGSGITPMMSILRHLRDVASPLGCTFVHGARTQADILFHEECLRLAAQMPQLTYHVTLSQAGTAWPGRSGRLEFELIREVAPDLPGSRYFLCGPGDFMDVLRSSLVAAGVPAQRVHTEQFHKSTQPAATAQ
jgi:ferredoxin-NADP reductase